MLSLPPPSNQGVGKTFTLELCLPQILILRTAPISTLSTQGVGKTFTLELCLRRMGVLPVCLSAGELEDEWAGEPGRRLRERYAFAGGLLLLTKCSVLQVGASEAAGRAGWAAASVLLPCPSPRAP